MREVLESKVLVSFFILFVLVILANSVSIKKMENDNTTKNYVYVNI